MSNDTVVTPAMDEVAEHLKSLGLGEDVDFYITGRTPGVLPSSEHIGMRADSGGIYTVWYRDMGRTTEYIETTDFDLARERFVTEALRLSAGRGSTATRRAE